MIDQATHPTRESIAGQAQRHAAPLVLHAPLITTRGVLITSLQFPYLTGIEVQSGQLTLASSYHAPKRLRAESCVFIPAHTRFDLLLLPQAHSFSTGHCHISLFPIQPCNHATSAPLSHTIAQWVFDEPGTPWTLTLISQRLGLVPRVLRRRLFAEGASVRAIIRTQRLMHAFMLLLRSPRSAKQIAAKTGWTSVATLEHAARETLLLDINQLGLVCSGAHAHCRPNNRVQPPAKWRDMRAD